MGCVVKFYGPCGWLKPGCEWRRPRAGTALGEAWGVEAGGLGGRGAGKGKGGEMGRGSGGARLAPWKRGFPRPAAGGRRDVAGAGG